jgi:surface protein
MSGMFSFAGPFNQPLNDWDVSNVTNMSRMFEGATKFNGAISRWNVSSVTDMSKMFLSATDTLPWGGGELCPCE